MLTFLSTLVAGCLGFIGGVGWQEILVILFVLLLLFGGKKLPELARGMGRGLRHFKEELHGVKKQISDTTDIDIDAPPEIEPAAPAAKRKARQAEEAKRAPKAETAESAEAEAQAEEPEKAEQNHD